jgi:hypothetical protein
MQNFILRPIPTSFPSAVNPVVVVEPEPSADRLGQSEADLLENLLPRESHVSSLQVHPDSTSDCYWSDRENKVVDNLQV